MVVSVNLCLLGRITRIASFLIRSGIKARLDVEYNEELAQTEYGESIRMAEL